jgi:hypothetical protein
MISPSPPGEGAGGEVEKIGRRNKMSYLEVNWGIK